MEEVSNVFSIIIVSLVPLIWHLFFYSFTV
jgi:hypothetical protein